MNNTFRCDFGIGESIGHFILWLILIVVTLGLALFVFPYYLLKAILNKTIVLDGSGNEVGRMRCEISLPGAVGNAFLWLLLSIVTLGLAYFIYFYRITTIVLGQTVIVPRF